MESVAESHVAEGGSVDFGARPLKRAIQHYVTSPLATMILKNPEKKLYTVDLKDDKITIK